MTMKTRPSAVSSTSWTEADVGVVEARDRTRFAQEASLGDRVVAQLVGQQLDRDGALESEITGEIDDAHAAGAEFLEDPIVRERGPDRRAHGPCLQPVPGQPATHSTRARILRRK